MSIEENIVPGKILYLKVCFPQDEKQIDKYFVLVGFDHNNHALLLKINSDNNYSKINKNLREHQFRIKSSQYTFLKYDSYLDCGKVWYMLRQKEVIIQLINDPKRLVGEVIEAHQNEILRLVNISRSISPIHKDVINQAFRGR